MYNIVNFGIVMVECQMCWCIGRGFFVVFYYFIVGYFNYYYIVGGYYVVFDVGRFDYYLLLCFVYCVDIVLGECYQMVSGKCQICCQYVGFQLF